MLWLDKIFGLFSFGSSDDLGFGSVPGGKMKRAPPTQPRGCLWFRGAVG